MNLLDKYILEIGKHLSRRNRPDLQAEIRSTIEDMLDDKARQADCPVDDVMIEEVLKEYGSPSKVAAAYHPTRYLIGPQIYPFFLMVVQIVLGVLFAVTLASFLWNYYNNPAGPAFLGSLGNSALQFFGGATAALGNIVLVFAILERFLPSTEFDESKDEWKPSDLLAEPDPELVSRGETIFEILFIVLGLTMLNLLPELIGLVIQSDNNWVYVPTLSATFKSYLPWINLLGVVSIVLDVYLLRQSHWQILTRAFSLVIDIAGIVLAGIMLNGLSLIDFRVADLSSTPVAGSADTLVQLVQLTPKIILIILIIVQSIEAIGIVRHFVFRRVTGKPLNNRSKL